MGILVSKKNQEKKISDAGQLSEKRYFSFHHILCLMFCSIFENN